MIKTTKPTFSIIISCYQAEKMIAATLDSILPQLGSDDEVIVVDDFSKDFSVEIVKKYTDSRLRLVLHQENKGMCKSRNTGLQYATNEYVAFMDSDDLWPENRQGRIIEALQQPDPPRVLSGQVVHFICPMMPRSMTKNYILPPTQSATLPGTVVFHQSLIKKAKGFNESLYCGEFLDLLSRMNIKDSEWEKIQAPVLQRRIHGMNYSLQKKHYQGDYFKALRQHIKRKVN